MLKCEKMINEKEMKTDKKEKMRKTEKDEKRGEGTCGRRKEGGGRKEVEGRR